MADNAGSAGNMSHTGDVSVGQSRTLSSGFGFGLRLVFCGLLAALALAKGGVPFPVVEVVLVPLALIMLATSFVKLKSDALEKLRAAIIGFIIILIAWSFWQSFPIPGDDIYDWRETLSNITGESFANTYSVAPSQTLWSIPRLILPFVVALCALSLFRHDHACVRFWQFSVLGLALFAAYGIVQMWFFPRWLLFEEKNHYIGSLTSSLVNRNSAATLLGLAAFASLTLALFFWQNPNLKNKNSYGWKGRLSALLRQPKLYIAIAAVDILALLLTQSRGGFIAFGAAALIAGLMLLPMIPFQTLWQRIGFLIVVVIAVLFFTDLLAGRIMYRMESEGVDAARLCVYGATLSAIQDYWPFGSGLGTFLDVHPQYRDLSCGLRWAWDRAHNTYLEMLLELGILYPVLLLTGLAAVTAILVKGWIKRRRFRVFITGTGAMTLMVILHSTVDFSMQIPVVSSFYAALLATGMTIALGRSDTKTSNQSPL
jgi:hypothetical protein